MKKRLLLLSLLALSLSVVAQTQYGWVEKSMFGGVARHRCVGVSIGTRGYMGLGHYNSTGNVLFDDWWEYDPGSDTWAQKANFPGGPRYHATGFSIGNYAYVGTGRDLAGNNYDDFYRYDPINNVWTPIHDMLGPARRGAVAFTIGNKGYVATGSYYNDIAEYDPATDTWTAKATFPGPGRLSSVGFAIGNKGYITTGDIGGNTNDMWEFDPQLNTWTAKASLPGLGRMEAGGFALMGKGYVGTGDDYSSGNNYQDFWCFDPVTNSWVQVADFAGTARRYLTTFTIGNRAYAGLGTSGMNYRDLWEFGSLNGVEEQVQTIPAMKVFPNPVQEEATITFPAEVRDAELKVVDAGGRLVQQIDHLSSSSFRFERNGLAPGTYFLLLQEDGTSKANAKIVLQ